MRKVWHWKFRYRISLTALEVHRISRPLKLTIFWLKTKIIIIETVILMKPSKFNNLLQKIKNALLGWNVVIFFIQFWRHYGFVINGLVLNYFFEKVCWHSEVYLILFQFFPNSCYFIFRWKTSLTHFKFKNICIQETIINF